MVNHFCMLTPFSRSNFTNSTRSLTRASIIAWSRVPSCWHNTQIYKQSCYKPHKVATLVHQSLSGISPLYLADDYHLVADARERRLQSTASQTCVVTRTHSTFGDRAFVAAGPGLWNSLPSHLKDADLSYSEFRRSLKTFLFGQWGHGAVWTRF